MNRHAMKRIAFDSFKSHLDYLRPNLMSDVFIDTFGRKSLRLGFSFGFFLKNVEHIWAVKPILRGKNICFNCLRPHFKTVQIHS